MKTEHLILIVFAAAFFMTQRRSDPPVIKPPKTSIENPGEKVVGVDGF